MAPSDEGAVATGDWGREKSPLQYKNEEISNIFSPSVSFADSSLVRGSLLGALLNCSINRNLPIYNNPI